ncbi:hypothetical protein RHSIM_Rhsim13G0079000 [Rhododendron simsii]|uniref:Uncharacterized protein n=1 Tax=Rhododendron simsii TaxID=118357 RepID=A0A834G576_RHOSS|nr:hypothetical protein RHSIM_Rhsim13G0079000 [Rhododendron simsii]
MDASGEDFSYATLRLINQMLMEEDDLQNKPCMFQQCSAIQATEKSFYDALGKEYPPPPSNQKPLAFLIEVLGAQMSLITSNGSSHESLDPNGSMEKTTHNREDGGYCTDGGRSNKQWASSAEELTTN